MAPTFELAFDCNAVGYALEMLRPNKDYGPSREGIALVRSGFVLIYAGTEVIPGGASDVV